MAHVHRLILCALLVLFAAPSYAVIPMQTMYAARIGSSFITGNYPTPAGACSAASAWAVAHSSYPVQGTSWQNGWCPIIGTDGKPTGGSIEIASVGQVCPDNSKSNGAGACSCETGYVESGNQCVLKQTNTCEGLPDFCQAAKGGKITLEGRGTAVPPGCAPDSGRPNCAQGCAGEAVGMSVSYKTADGSWMTGQEYRITGGTCTLPAPSDVPAKKESDCAGSVGEVNGVRVCVPNQAATGDTSSKETKNGDGTSSNTTSKTTCENGVCKTESTTTNKDASGNTTSTSTSTTTTSQREYCANNKSSSVCAATNGDKNPDGKDGSGKDGDGDKCEGDDCEDKPSKFEGSCAAGFTCEGDAIQCAIAKDQHLRTCSLNDTENPFYKLWQSDPNKDKSGSVLSGLAGNKSINVADYIKDRDDFIGGRACPADRVISGPRWEVSIPYSKLCPYLEMLGNVAVICASIVAARIITGRAA